MSLHLAAAAAIWTFYAAHFAATEAIAAVLPAVYPAVALFMRPADVLFEHPLDFRTVTIDDLATFGTS